MMVSRGGGKGGNLIPSGKNVIQGWLRFYSGWMEVSATGKTDGYGGRRQGKGSLIPLFFY